MKTLKEILLESSKSFEDQIFDYIKPYLKTICNYSSIKQDYSKYYNDIVKPVEALVKTHNGTGSVNVQVWYDNIYIGWQGTSEKYKGKDIFFCVCNNPASDKTYISVKVNWPGPKNGVKCKCSEELKKKILGELHPITAKLYS